MLILTFDKNFSVGHKILLNFHQFTIPIFIAIKILSFYIHIMYKYNYRKNTGVKKKDQVVTKEKSIVMIVTGIEVVSMMTEKRIIEKKKLIININQSMKNMNMIIKRAL